MAPQRDYYADLELPSTADVAEVKKQFRKLALKYHPDRNPGREEEVNHKFQIIQAANEVLSDPHAKAKYDASYSRSSASATASARYSGSSGVRGNPWQNVSQQFPTPPRRNAAQPRPPPTSGAQRWQDRFTNGVPPTAKQQTSADRSNAANAAKAFENMRKGGSSQTSYSTGQRQERPVPPPPPPPRTESAKKRAEASFGTRKTGYYPHSAVPGDEPPVANSNYSSRPNFERQPPIPDPLAQFREREKNEFPEHHQEPTPDEFPDTRQSTPYSKNSGERTNPFDGINLNRANSTRETTSRETASKPTESSPTKPQFRSSSVPRAEKREDSRTRTDGIRDDDRQQSTPASPSLRPKAPMKSRKNTRTTTSPPGDNHAEPAKSTAEQTAPATNTSASEANGPSMYATPKQRTQLRSPTQHTPSNNQLDGAQGCTIKDFAEKQSDYGSSAHASGLPSGANMPDFDLTPFEKKQSLLLRFLINQKRVPLYGRQSSENSPCPETQNMKPTPEFATDAWNSFNIPLDDDIFSTNLPKPSQSGRSSTENINTNFVNAENANPWNFTSASPNPKSNPASRSQSGSRAHSRSSRPSPSKRPNLNNDDAPEPINLNQTGQSTTPTSDQPEQTTTGFDANGWSDKFGPQTFVPQPTSSNVSTSPTRATRGRSSREDEKITYRGRKKTPVTDGTQAMDIDPPQELPANEPVMPKTPTEETGPRNVHVEPSRTDWDFENFYNLSSMAENNNAGASEKIPVTVNHMGSEDVEELKTTFVDLKNVAPLAEQASGLKSFTDMKDNLPFQSTASKEAPIEIPHAHPLVFPTVPVAPRRPPFIAIEGLKPEVSSWSKYLEEFESYQRQWDAFNDQVVEHFATRSKIIATMRKEKGYSFLGAQGDKGVIEYHHWMEQDNDVRRRWVAACEQHEIHFREFMEFRERMK